MKPLKFWGLWVKGPFGHGLKGHLLICVSAVLCCAAQRAMSQCDSLPAAAQELAGSWQIAVWDKGVRKLHIIQGCSGGAGESLEPRQWDNLKVEKTAVIKYKCVYYYTGPMLYNFTHTHICDLQLQLHTEKKLANLPKLIGKPLKIPNWKEQ